MQMVSQHHGLKHFHILMNRLVGLDKIGVVAEIWIHTDLNNLSDENDIVRINDDYKRT